MRARALASAASGFGAAASSIGLMAASAWLIARAAEHPPVLYLMVAIVSVRAFALSRSVLRYGERLAGHDAAFRLLADTRARAFTALERGGGRGLRSGDIAARFVSDMDATMDVLTRVILPFTVALLAGLASAVFLGALLPPLGLATIAFVVLVAAGVPALQRAAAGRAERRLAPLRGELSAQVVELVHGAADLLAHGAAPRRLDALAETDRRLARAAARSSLGVGLGQALVTAAGGALVGAALALGTPAVRAGTLDGVLLAVVVLTPLAIVEALGGLPAAAAQLGQARSALRRVRSLVTAAPPPPAGTRELPPAPHTVALENVTARWAPGEPAVFDGLSLTLAPGQRVALVGPSGVGKSTVAALLTRFLDPETGRVTLNGVDLRELDPDAVRGVVGLVAQDAHVFDTTIEENLRIGDPHATTAQLRHALAACRLLDWVDALPRGLATLVGEGGMKLSGGQRRRLVLARALLADFPVLILDEPNEHLDAPTAAAITTDLLAATAGRTVLLITHHTFGLDLVDAVIHLNARRG